MVVVEEVVVAVLVVVIVLSVVDCSTIERMLGSIYYKVYACIHLDLYCVFRKGDDTGIRGNV